MPKIVNFWSTNFDGEINPRSKNKIIPGFFFKIMAGFLISMTLGQGVEMELIK